MELEIKPGLGLLEKNKRMTSAGLNPIELFPATTGLMNSLWKLPLDPVGIKVHLMVFSGKPGESYSNIPNTYHAVFFVISEIKIVLRRTLIFARKTRIHNLLPQRQLQGQTLPQLQQLREHKQQQLLLLQQPPATVDWSTGNQE